MGFGGVVYPRAGLPQICENSDSSLGLERREGSVVGRASEDGEVVEKPHVEEKEGAHLCLSWLGGVGVNGPSWCCHVVIHENAYITPVRSFVAAIAASAL